MDKERSIVLVRYIVSIFIALPKYNA